MQIMYGINFSHAAHTRSRTRTRARGAPRIHRVDRRGYCEMLGQTDGRDYAYNWLQTWSSYRAKSATFSSILAADSTTFPDPSPEQSILNLLSNNLTLFLIKFLTNRFCDWQDRAKRITVASNLIEINTLEKDLKYFNTSEWKFDTFQGLKLAFCSPN